MPRLTPRPLVQIRAPRAVAAAIALPSPLELFLAPVRRVLRVIAAALLAR